uniref:Nucleoside-diphosphate-sugar epimerase n=1 Tax=Ganoderma boninense TaxID=34458 RepID=A0A5K1K040_9APHY|nr:Nucleoside-diphosphate-sugar epimerase [Ganoderma boninense]
MVLGLTLSTMPFLSSVSLPLDARPPYDGPHDCLSALDASLNTILVPQQPETSLGDLAIEDEMPLSGHLPPSSLPASQISDFSLNASYADMASTDTEEFGSYKVTGTLGHSDTEEDTMATEAPVVTDMLTCDSYVSTTTSEGPRLPPLDSSVDQDITSELPASSPPSSSPPGLFSSPTRSVSGSPPSSSPVGPPCDVEDTLPTPRTKNVDHSSPRSSSQASPPNPTRPTQASQARQHKKLVAPFRSPVIKGPLVHGGLHAVYASGRAVAPGMASTSKRPAEDNAMETIPAAESDPHVPNKDRTARAAKQFKPPMQVANGIASSDSNPASLRVGAVPTIQTLQGQVQMLKQAIKIKNSGGSNEDEALEQLVEKWTAVGREVAWALWDHVKDMDPGTAAPPQNGGWRVDDDDEVAEPKRGFDPSWGYEDEPVRKKARMDEDVEREEPHHTIGIMLRRLGIDPDTLGWNEDEGDFVDL